MRKVSIALAIIPFIVVGIFSYLSTLEKGLDVFGPFITLLYFMPVLALISVASVILAYRKREAPENLDRTAKVLSLVSAFLFVIGALLAILTLGLQLW